MLLSNGFVKDKQDLQLCVSYAVGAVLYAFAGVVAMGGRGWGSGGRQDKIRQNKTRPSPRQETEQG
jgi:hypothetical protein